MLNREVLEKGLKEIVARKLDVEPAEVTPEARLEQDLGADSVDAVEIVMEIEQEYVIDLSHLDDEEEDMFKTFGGIFSLVEGKLRELKAAGKTTAAL